ncbi:voltage-dependent anion channel-domain-containing protein [Ustulina deusta]|nr:voltage-dependent anion channel-domain-containing protein [Ustulina deusta]
MPCTQPNRDEVREMGFELSEISLGHDALGQASHLTRDPRDLIPAPPYREASSSRSSDIVNSESTVQGWQGYLAEEGRLQWIVEPVQDGVWALVQRFDFSWFAWSVGIGITSILIHTASEVYPPYQVYLLTTSIIYFMVNVVLFCSISALTITRYCIWPRLFLVMMNHPSQAGFVAMMPMALATIVTMCSKLVGSNQKAITAIWAMWWVDMVISLVIPFVVQFRPFSCQINRGNLWVEELVARCFLPVTALVVVAAAGSDVAAKLEGTPALVTIMIGYILLLLTLFPVLMAIPFYCSRLLVGKNTPAENVIGAFVSITALAQMVLATQQLGEQAFRTFPRVDTLSNAPEGDDTSIGSVCDTTGIVLAIFMWCLGFLWFILVYAMYTIVVPSNQLVSSFNLSRWNVQISYGFFALSALRLGMRPLSASMLFTQFGIFLGLVAVWNCHLYSCIMVQLARDDGLTRVLNAPELAGPWNLQAADTHSTTSPHGPWWTHILSVAAGCWRAMIRSRTSRE